ncbi:type I-E CRISPR-associated protein Cse2/CasB [Nocardiopsis dassonvillei]|uniref:CRISPR-associated protein, Cse2 family n=1 Tax=Nocardiopsis dassonvillei (strain ATCC 23218 / DSM 43111 / CIP 107115 / JCM 7437 / KCTC 9190 / NBRC 14626 / NCTC 10488 / NRRL B-5397 / IMRU 509) TaxID=446468 RepID=D7B2M2_NOCDD|nr:type I-E CRISPR-associated protein Cse2/CasB [Nocardiopsis dassonvillei]ADH66720.1 CRISPR-associated protein, Cse2 family [Nocardiopsis dassonvillei subsp. dassonvillei DSM 43111]VEI92743.1 CRISPR type I-E/ECOLI-associated protein CasB/Cse2 [Nocardiopsis dassonvillei]
MTTTSTAEFVPGLKDVGALVDERVRQLQGGYLKDLPEAVATLAKLRRGAGKPIEAVPELVGLTLDHRFYERFSVADPRIEDAEAAAHEALTLYALHQQSKRERGMHRRGRDLGGAVRRLMPTGDIDEPLRRRFVQAGSAVHHATRLDRLRGIVQLLRAEDVPLDYGLLADQLHDARTRPGAEHVRRAWGRGFQAYRHSEGTDAGGIDTGGTEADDATGHQGRQGTETATGASD